MKDLREQLGVSKPDVAMKRKSWMNFDRHQKSGKQKHGLILPKDKKKGRPCLCVWMGRSSDNNETIKGFKGDLSYKTFFFFFFPLHLYINQMKNANVKDVKSVSFSL